MTMICAAVEEILIAYNEANPDRPILVEAVPPYKRLVEEGLGPFLLPPPAE